MADSRGGPPPTPSPGGDAGGAPAAWRPGAVVHGYRLMERLGAGGFGEVWRGENLDHESFALKFGRDDLAADTRAALRREIDVFLRLRGERGVASFAGARPPVVALKQDLLDADPPTLVMEFLAGGDLRAWMRDRAGRRLTLAESLPIVRDVLAALAFAHARGVVHRDLSPENILLDREARRWKVADFGVGGFLAETELSFLRSGASSQLSREVVGKIDYMAPEMRRGEAVGPATDLYSLGVVWVQLLTGRMESGLSATWMRLVPPEVLPLLERCLDDDPRGRWRDAESLAAAIDEACAEGGANAAAAPGAGPGDTAGWGAPDGATPPFAATIRAAATAGADRRDRRWRLLPRLAGDVRGAVVAGTISAAVVGLLLLASVTLVWRAPDSVAPRSADGASRAPRAGDGESPRLLASLPDRAPGERAEPAPIEPSKEPAPAPPLPPPLHPGTIPLPPVAPDRQPPVSRVAVAVVPGSSGTRLDASPATATRGPTTTYPPGPLSLDGPLGGPTRSASSVAGTSAAPHVPSDPFDGTISFLTWPTLRSYFTQAGDSVPALLASLDDLSRRGDAASILRVASRSSDLPVLRVVEPLLEARRLAPPRVIEEAISRADDALAELDLDRLLRERGAAAVHLMAGLMEKNLIAVGEQSDPVAWYEAAGRSGHLPSMTRLGEMYYYGRRVRRDPAAARRYFEQAAEGGEPRAMYNLAVLIEDLARATGAAGPPDEARAWYARAADAGDIAAMLALADLAEADGDLAARVEWTRRAAREGHGDGLAALARLYQEGHGVERDLARAAELYARAADRQHAGAMNNLAGLLLEGGDGLTSDRDEALRLYRRAADLGSDEAAANLARLGSDASR